MLIKISIKKKIFISKKKNLNNNFKINKKYNIRYYKRLTNNQLSLKDKFFDKLKDLFFIKSY